MFLNIMMLLQSSSIYYFNSGFAFNSYKHVAESQAELKKIVAEKQR